ncbi:unnamed protein product [Litomosoides sigmodontis]|uniref:Uncharacterized protein n=1 Tax=Litomosoides sigmodontis TaxID=42156 RepID=A0A3P6T5T0_LITSI|nr:unnamed protein product [Litomosoides sigmodontis]
MMKSTRRKKNHSEQRCINTLNHDQPGNKTGTSGNSKSFDGIIDVKRPHVVPPTLNESSKWRYIGVCTKREAESFLRHFTEFRLYHQWDTTVNLDDIKRLPLTVVYLSSVGDYFHWLVRTMGEVTKNNHTKQKEYKIRSYYIEHCGPSLPTLDELIKCYESRSYNRRGNVDVFRLP